MSSAAKLKVLKTLGDVQYHLNWSDEHLRQVLEVSDRELRLIRLGLKELSLKSLERFCFTTGITVGKFLSGEIDFLALSKQSEGNQLAVPEKYRNKNHELARVRSLKSAHSFLNYFFGTEYTRNVFNRLQIRPAFIHQAPSTFMNWGIFLDLLKELKDAGIHDSQLKLVGLMNFSTFQQESPAWVPGARDPFELYEMTHDDSGSYVDHIFNYRIISRNDDVIVCEVTPSELARDSFERKPVGVRENCLYRLGTYAALPIRFGKFAQVKEISCQHLGDSSCRYEISYDRPEQDIWVSAYAAALLTKTRSIKRLS